MKSTTCCRPRANPALLAELDRLTRERERVVAQVARLEFAVELMQSGEWKLERDTEVRA
jgi:hypothetical protein